MVWFIEVLAQHNVRIPREQKKRLKKYAVDRGEKEAYITSVALEEFMKNHPAPANITSFRLAA